MAGNPFFQDLDPYAVPDAVTPYDTPSSAGGYAGVTPPGTGPAPAPYSISAPQDIPGITAAVQAAMNLTGGEEGTGIDVATQAAMSIPGYSPGSGAVGAGIPDRDSPRQAAAEAFMTSPQGSGAVSITAGFPDYENTDVSPGANMENPIQGHTADYPGTLQAGIPKYMPDEGGPLPGAPPGGSMGPSAGGNYPGTTQEGLTKYGTS